MIRWCMVPEMWCARQTDGWLDRQTDGRMENEKPTEKPTTMVGAPCKKFKKEDWRGGDLLQITR